MRPFRDVLYMWNQYNDGELLDWHWMYERSLRISSGNRHAEYMSQDLAAITQLLQRRKLLP
jgi:hypothetical protein